MIFTRLSLKGRALRLLAQREHSRAELHQKLLRHVQEGEVLGALLDALCAQGWIDETRVAQSLVHQRSARLGTQRLVQEMRRKGLSEELIRTTAHELRASEVQRAQHVWAQRFGQVAIDAPERAKQMRFLVARGFSMEAVRLALRGRGDDAGDIRDSDGV